MQSTIKPRGPRAKREILKIPHEPVYHPHTAGARFIQTLQQECLDYFVVFGEQHMNYVVSEMVAHYHEERPHQGKKNQELSRALRKAPKRQEKSGTPPDVVPL